MRPLLIVVLLASTVCAGHSPVSDEVRQILDEAFTAPGTTWSAVEQPFWPHVRVFKAVTVSDRRWYHRPTVAVDKNGKGHVITDGIFMVPPADPLSEFNTLSESEHVAVDSANVTDYATFFLKSFLLYRDTLCLSSSLPTLPKTGALPAGFCTDPLPVRVSTHGSRFAVDTVVVDRVGRWAQARRFSIGSNGQVSSIW